MTVTYSQQKVKFLLTNVQYIQFFQAKVGRDVVRLVRGERGKRKTQGGDQKGEENDEIEWNNKG